MRLAIALSALALLAGCQTTPPKPIIQTRTITITRPVYVPLDPKLYTMPPFAQVWTNGDLFNDDQVCRGKLRGIAKLQPKSAEHQPIEATHER